MYSNQAETDRRRDRGRSWRWIGHTLIESGSSTTRNLWIGTLRERGRGVTGREFDKRHQRSGLAWKIIKRLAEDEKGVEDV